MRTALVCGSRGFIGNHLIHYLHSKGYWVRGVDICGDHSYRNRFGYQENDFWHRDLRDPVVCSKVLTPMSGLMDGPFDEVYQLAADMGGMGFIESHETEIMRNNMLINLHMANWASATGVGRYFFSSSVCIYPDMLPSDPPLEELGAYPAQPDNEYGWEKLYTERMLLAMARNNELPIVRIARLQNTYGPHGAWEGGREKAVAALCRKAALCENGGELEVWGDGTAIRCFSYIDDMVEGIYGVMHASWPGPFNLGTSQQYSMEMVARQVIEASGKDLTIKYVEGPVGVRSRNFSKDQARWIGWQANVSLGTGIQQTYDWIKEQVDIPCPF